MRVNVAEKDVMDPVAKTDRNIMELSPIPNKIANITFLDNTKPNADIILKTIKEDINIYSIETTKAAGAPITPNQFQKSREGDVIILALGDCGSCTTWLVLDAISFEKEKTPTVCICTDKFAPYARSLADAYGVANLRVVEILHPIAGLQKDAVREKSISIVSEVKKILNIPYNSFKSVKDGKER